MRSALTSSKAGAFDAEVERALASALKWDADDNEGKERRLKALAISVKWCAVKSKIVTSEHGLGLADDDEPGGF